MYARVGRGRGDNRADQEGTGSRGGVTLRGGGGGREEGEAVKFLLPTLRVSVRACFSRDSKAPAKFHYPSHFFFSLSTLFVRGNAM